MATTSDSVSPRSEALTMSLSDTSEVTIQPASADRAIRIGFCVFSLIASFFAIRFALSISGFDTVFADMLGGRPLPAITQFVLNTKPLWVGLSVVCAILPFAAAFLIRRTSTAIYGIVAATAIQILQVCFLWTALTAPLVSIISGMSAGY